VHCLPRSRSEANEGCRAEARRAKKGWSGFANRPAKENMVSPIQTKRGKIGKWLRLRIPVVSSEAWFASKSFRFRIRSLKARYLRQKTEFDVIKWHLRSTDIACDIGANKGSFIYWLSYWCWNGRVVAFEPQPDLSRGLVDICRALRLCNVKIEAKAVYSHSGNRDLFIPTGHQPGASLRRNALEGESFTVLSVPMVSLDDYFGDNDEIGLLKIDAEGAEFDILKGAERILRRNAPLLVFECENRHLAPGRVEDVFSYLENLGYEGNFVRYNQLSPISEFDAEIHQRQDGEWFWKRKDYCNNFIFRKSRG
jgi:FkbM family methyltransferase